MSTALDAPRARSPQPVASTPVAAHLPMAKEAPPPPTASRPDSWGLWFWLACAGFLLLMQMLDTIKGVWNWLF